MATIKKKKMEKKKKKKICAIVKPCIVEDIKNVLTDSFQYNSVGKYLVMFLVGLIVISLINLLLSKVLGYNLSAVDWIISVLFIIVFMGITAYDTQKIMNASKYANEEQEEIYKKLSVYGALQLYLDFINIFLRLLRLTGRRR